MTKPKNEKKRESQSVLRRFLRHRMAAVGFVVLLLMTLSVLFLPPLLGLDPYTTGQGMPFSAPTAEHLLGTDNAGRDSFARLLYGGRVSLLVGLVSTAISILIGVPLGMISAYYGGMVDSIVMRLADIFLSFPSTIFILVLVSVVGPSLWTLVLVMGILSWPEFARLIRGNVMSIRKKEYVESAKAIGAKDAYLLMKHVLPNAIGPIIVAATFRVAGAILQESSLSFLGMGVVPPEASWGNILNGAQSITVLTTCPWAWIPAGTLLVVTICCINFIGDGLRDALDPHARV